MVPEPKHISVPIHGNDVVTCLIFSKGRIFAALDNCQIRVYEPSTGKLLLLLEGHEGGIWSLSVRNDTVVSGSTDRTVRIWDLKTGLCTHTLEGHTDTVRALAIVKPEWVDVKQEDGSVVKEKWPKRSLIVSGSRDNTLRVWTLPKPGEVELKGPTVNPAEGGSPTSSNPTNSPYHRMTLEGHGDAVRSLAARGRIAVSGSYDNTVRVWDIVTGTCIWVLSGHKHKVYAVLLDVARNQVYSGSMDNDVRIWNLENGRCQHVLSGHASLVVLLSVTPSHLVSGAADATLRVWNPVTGELQCTFSEHVSAITSFWHDEYRVLSGSSGALKMWNIRDGTLIRDFLVGATGVWQVVVEGRWWAAAWNQDNTTYLDICDFGEDDPDWVKVPQGGVGEEDGELSEDENEPDVPRDAKSIEDDQTEGDSTPTNSRDQGQPLEPETTG